MTMGSERHFSELLPCHLEFSRIVQSKGLVVTFYGHNMYTHMVYVRAVITRGNGAAYDKQVGIMNTVGGMRYDPSTGRANLVTTAYKQTIMSSMKGAAKMLMQINGQPDFFPDLKDIPVMTLRYD